MILHDAGLLFVLVMYCIQDNKQSRRARSDDVLHANMTNKLEFSRFGETGEWNDVPDILDSSHILHQPLKSKPETSVWHSPVKDTVNVQKVQHNQRQLPIQLLIKHAIALSDSKKKMSSRTHSAADPSTTSKIPLPAQPT